MCGLVNLDAAAETYDLRDVDAGTYDRSRFAEIGVRLPTGVVRGGGPRLDDEDEEFYRQEKQS